MHSNSVVYQTLEDRFDADYVENHGPFICDSKTAWLGNGYYFWDHHIELGHWWGKVRYGGKDYLVCKGLCNLASELCWDLHNNGNHREEFIVALNLIIDYKIEKPDQITVPQVIEYAKKNGFFNHEAIKARGINSATEILDEVNVGARLLFSSSNSGAYFDVYPQIQICLLKKTSISFRNFHIVWPEHYFQEELVF